MKRGGPRVDLSLLLFNARDSINDLWRAADQAVSDGDAAPPLSDAVEKLRSIFGDTEGQ